jgi:hypothetical protein
MCPTCGGTAGREDFAIEIAQCEVMEPSMVNLIESDSEGRGRDDNTY